MRRTIFSAVAGMALLSGCQTVDTLKQSVTGLFDRNPKIESAPSSEATDMTARSPVPPPPPQLEQYIEGTISADHVLDGNRIRIGAYFIRLFGIYAPNREQKCRVHESDVPCGEISKDALVGFVAGDITKCLKKERDRFGDILGVCHTGTTNISSIMVQSGMALAYRDQSTDYVVDEMTASDKRLGIWKSEFEMPWDWDSKQPYFKIRKTTK